MWRDDDIKKKRLVLFEWAGQARVWVFRVIKDVSDENR